MLTGNPIREQIAELRLRPAVDQALRNEMQVRSWIDAVCRARADDREHRGGPVAAEIAPGEQPISATKNELSDLPLNMIVRELNATVFEEKAESRPLPVKICERSAKRSLRRDRPSMKIDPRAKLVEDRQALKKSPRFSLLVRIIRANRGALDREQAPDNPQSLERQAVAALSGIHQTPAPVRHAAGTPTALALDEVGDGGAIALNCRTQDVAEEATNAVGVSAFRIREADPLRVDPAPHGAGADPVGRISIEHRNSGCICRQNSRLACFFRDGSCDGLQKIDRGADTAPERLRRNVDARTRPSQTLSLDRLMLEEFVSELRR